MTTTSTTSRRAAGSRAAIPQLIKDVFEPGRVLDMGCGPGALMYLLHELAVEVRRHRLQPRRASSSPRPRYVTGSPSARSTEPLVAKRAYDLVVCREVMEHLTVAQVARCVEQLCRASSRYVYVTTRFHPTTRTACCVHDPVRRRPMPHHAAQQGVPPLPVRARGLPLTSRSRGAHGLGRQGSGAGSRTAALRTKVTLPGQSPSGAVGARDLMRLQIDAVAGNQFDRFRSGRRAVQSRTRRTLGRVRRRRRRSQPRGGSVPPGLREVRGTAGR